MQQTNKYKFNLIEMSDPFSPEKLNENAQQLEDALIEHETTVDSRITDHETTVSAALARHKSETDAALASQQQAWQAADKTLSQTITAVEQGAKLFHLAGPVVNSDTMAPITINLSGIDMSQYRALLIFARTVYKESLIKEQGSQIYSQK